MTAPQTIDFLGATFRLADKVGAMPTIEFARIQQKMAAGESDDPDAQLSRVLALLDIAEEMIAGDELERFEKHAKASHADFDDLSDLVTRAVQLKQGRPTGRSSDSSDGPRIIEPSSPDGSSSPDTGPQNVIDMFNHKGRPDLALVVRRRQESLTG